MIVTAFSLLIGLMALSLPVAAALGLMGFILSQKYAFFPLTGALGELAWNTSNDFILIAAPMFIMMGELMHRSGMSERLFSALAPWFARIPGRLIHTNIAASAIFAATSGSSVATAATIGTVAIPNMAKGGYNPPLFLGSIAAGGTLGILIPPSINMIVYGVLTETSIPKLYLAGFIPGLVLATLFSLTVLIFCIVRPQLAGRRTSATWEQRWTALPDLLPPLIIFLAVIGSIYAGWATATESAALGVIAALAIAAWNRRLTLRTLLHAFEGTMRTTAMIMAILLAAYFLNFVITSIGLTTQVNRFITGLQLTPVQLLIAVVMFYFVLGMFMETLSMMVATVPIIAPIMFKAGFDPVWFGIIIIILMELAMITPPVGINLYVVQGLRKRGRIDDVIIGASPFVITMMIMVVILSIWPEIALWLPKLAAN
ncbi:MAG: TRAP transporter large permease [Microvirga sp.]